jgi:hypothetical protein
VTTRRQPQPEPDPETESGLDFTYERADVAGAAARIVALLSLAVVTACAIGILVFTWVMLLKVFEPDQAPVTAMTMF